MATSLKLHNSILIKWLAILFRYTQAQSENVEEAIEKIAYLMSKDYLLSLSSREYEISRRSIALLLLQKEPVFLQKVREQELRYPEIEQVVQATQAQFDESLSLVIAQTQQQLAAKIANNVIYQAHVSRRCLMSSLSQ